MSARPATAVGPPSRTCPGQRRRGSATAGGALDVALLGAGRERALGHSSLAYPGTQCGESAVKVRYLGGGDVPRQLHQGSVELLERGLALFVADDDVVDRRLADDP